MATLSRTSPKLALLGFTIRQSLTERKVWLVMLLLVLPAGLALLMRLFGGEMYEPLEWMQYHMVLQRVAFSGALPLACLLFGPAIMGAEADSGTLAYLLTRQMRRASVLVIRFVAISLVLSVLTGLAVLACHLCAVGGADSDTINWMAPGWQPSHDVLYYIVMSGPATVAFLAVFTVISMISNRTLVVSAMYLVIIEVFLANLPIAARAYTITHQVRKTLVAMIPNTITVHGQSPGKLRDALYPPGESGLWALALLVGILLAAGCALVTYRELVPTKVARD